VLLSWARSVCVCVCMCVRLFVGGGWGTSLSELRYTLLRLPFSSIVDVIAAE
jgi:hypothetical protein